MCLECRTSELSSREPIYPTWEKGKSSSKVPFKGDMLVPWRVNCIEMFFFVLDLVEFGKGFNGWVGLMMLLKKGRVCFFLRKN